MRNDRFNRGNSTFLCDVCGRRTRYTGTQSIGSKLCPQCFDLAGIENAISDNGEGGYQKYHREARRLLLELLNLGGDLTSWADLATTLDRYDAGDCVKDVDAPPPPSVKPTIVVVKTRDGRFQNAMTGKYISRSLALSLGAK